MVLSDFEIMTYSMFEPDAVIVHNNPKTGAVETLAYHWSDVDGPIEERVDQISEHYAVIKPYWYPFIKEKHPNFKPMIAPFEKSLINKNEHGNRLISYGTSSYGYDIRCANQFKVFTNINSTIVDPKNFDENCFVNVEGDSCVIPPNSFALARTVEYFSIPRNLMTICLGKSTYARCGIVVNVTPFEPGWEGHVTLEFSNTTPLPAKIYANEGVAQVLFLRGSKMCRTSYSDRGGKYQGQTGVVLPRM